MKNLYKIIFFFTLFAFNSNTLAQNSFLSEEMSQMTKSLKELEYRAEKYYEIKEIEKKREEKAKIKEIVKELGGGLNELFKTEKAKDVIKIYIKLTEISLKLNPSPRGNQVKTLDRLEETSNPTQNLKEIQEATWAITNGLTHGSAFFISPDTAVTNFHVIWDLFDFSEKDSKPRSIFLFQKQSPFVLMLDEVLFVDSTHDLAVFTVSPVKTDTYKAVAAQIYLSTMREITLSKRGEKIQKIRESDTYQKDLITRHTSPYYLKTKEEEATDSNEVLSIFGYPETIFESYAGQSTLLLDYQSLLISKNISSSRVGISGGPVINKANKLVGIAHSSSKQDYNKILFSSSQSLIAIYNRTTGTDCKEFLLLKECMLTAIRHTLSKAEQGDATSQFQIKLGGDHFSSF